MILHPIGSSCHLSGLASPWSVIEPRQRAMADAWWLISQPDHAALSGALAAHFVAPGFPSLDPLLARAIEVHDSGWGLFESEARPAAAPAVDARGKPLSFIEIAPPDFLRAWTASINGAEQACPAGGCIVSRHFCSLADGRLGARIDGPENTKLLAGFVAAESARQQRLLLQAGRSRGELETLVAVLQFCDLLSLYLCCGATEAVEFPQDFPAGHVRLQPRDGAFVFTPSPFQPSASLPADAISLGVQARRYPPAPSIDNTTVLAFVLW